MKNIEWNSDNSRVLTNPRLHNDEKLLIEKGLLSLDFPAHFWVATSGSSAIHKKWAALSKKALLSSAQAINEHLMSDSSDRWLHALPDFHVGGLGIWARAHLSGADVIDYKSSHHKWSPKLFAQEASKENVTLTALVPTQLYDLVKGEFKAPKSLRASIIGGGALNEALYRQSIALGWNPLPSYGLTECCSQVATAPLESADNGEFPMLKILSHFNASTNNEGVLEVSGDALLTTYAFFEGERIRVNDPKKEGAFTTGDLVHIEGRFLKFIGRSTDFVKIGGESVNVTGLNTLLEQIRAESGIGGDQVVVAVPDERLGHVLHLAHAETALRELDNLLNAYKERTLPFEGIKQMHQVESIPRSSLKKLKKNVLMNKIFPLVDWEV